MIRHREVDSFVDDEVAEHELGGEDKPPIE
jgi:hypothetical protein